MREEKRWWESREREISKEAFMRLSQVTTSEGMFVIKYGGSLESVMQYHLGVDTPGN